ncbi:hypothetical protein AMATHDRAFT_74208 [Amanita thiersii Skay4041]|uniref:TFIIB-type domain-containing protein n=1 Tax=Amanita thiersii Skay4041 TaxID=703135 RepID=A0A2A9NX29_9AGAR|nr:hypothetical protein AMATHDRAFT_74208 [Amanita thiersii Skay4041]
MTCVECNVPTLWDDDAASLICPLCGSLADPSQSQLLDTHTNAHSTAPCLPFNPPRSSWTLASQAKEVRHRKNEHAITELIHSLAVSLNLPGLSPRATYFFNQAMTVGYLRWGRQARLAAGVSISLALREANLPHSLHDIASRLQEPFPTLSHTFLSIASLLHIKLKPSDPSIYISTLHSYLVTALPDPLQSSSLPPSLINLLSPLNFRSVSSTAHSLCTTFNRTLGTPLPPQLTPAPTACALFILSIEAEAGDPLPHLAQIASFLGARCHIGQGLVMSRYKLLQDQIASWIEQVPWLNKYTRKNGRSKVSKRTVVALGLKDALAYREKLCQGIIRPHVSPGNGVIVGSQTQERGSCPSLDPIRLDIRPRKKQKQRHDAQLQVAAEFLRDPTGPSSSLLPLRTLQQLASSILTKASDTSAASKAPLTRLQLLARERQGSGPTEITDEELFEEGELEAMFRTEEERHVMSQILAQTLEEYDQQQQQKNTEKHQPRRKRQKGRTAAPVSDRVDMDAFQEFMRQDATTTQAGGSDEGPSFGLGFATMNTNRRKRLIVGSV